MRCLSLSFLIYKIGLVTDPSLGVVTKVVAGCAWKMPHPAPYPQKGLDEWKLLAGSFLGSFGDGLVGSQTCHLRDATSCLHGKPRTLSPGAPQAQSQQVMPTIPKPCCALSSGKNVPLIPGSPSVNKREQTWHRLLSDISEPLLQLWQAGLLAYQTQWLLFSILAISSSWGQSLYSVASWIHVSPQCKNLSRLHTFRLPQISWPGEKTPHLPATPNLLAWGEKTTIRGDDEEP